jgi:hypothetical protein
MAREMHFRALGQETFTSALTAASEGGAAALGAHAGAETVLLFPGSLRSL